MDDAYIASVRQPLQIAALGRSATGERIQQANPGVGEIHHIACHHRQLMQHRDGSDLFINGVLGIRYTQTAPDLSSIAIQCQYPIAVIVQHLIKPLFKHSSLLTITTMANQLHATP